MKLSSTKIGFILLFVVTFAVASPFLYRDLPRTDGMIHYFKSWYIRWGLDNYGKIFEWNPFWYAGHTLFRFYSPLSYFETAFLSYLIPVELFRVYNLTIFFSYFVLAFSSYFLTRTLKFSKLTSFFVAFLIVIAPRLAYGTAFVGHTPEVIAFSFVPFALGFAIKSFEKRKLKYIILAYLFTAIVILTHNVTAYLLFLLIALLFVVKTFPFKVNFKSSVKTFSLIIGGSFLVSAFWVAPALLEFENFNLYEQKSPISTSIFTAPVSATCRDFACLGSLSIELSALAFIGLIFSFVSLQKDQKFALRFSKNQNYFYIVLVFLILTLVLLSQEFGFKEFIPFGVGINFDRVGFYLLVPMALLAGVVTEKLSISKTIKIALLILLVAVFLRHAIISFERTNAFLIETGANPREESKPFYDIISKFGEGRIVFYGFFEPGLVSAIPANTQKSVLLGGYNQSAINHAKLAGKINDASEVAAWVNTTTKEEFESILKRSFVRYVILNVCDPEGRNVAPLVEGYKIVNESRCIVVLENPTLVTFTEPAYNWERKNPESIVIRNVTRGEVLVKEMFYSHWHAYCQNSEYKIKQNEFGLIIVDADNCEELALKFEVPSFYNIFTIISLVTFIFSVTLLFKPQLLKIKLQV